MHRRVEIAYFTLEGFEARGFATATARALCGIADQAAERPLVVAKTLAQPNASTRILRRLGFALVGDTHDDEVGTAWLWERPAGGSPVPTVGRRA